jgi:integrase
MASLHAAPSARVLCEVSGPSEQRAEVRKKIKTHPDAGLHALRHTFLTEAGEYTDPFTLQYVAGHDNIKTMMRYVHAQEAAVH